MTDGCTDDAANGTECTIVPNSGDCINVAFGNDSCAFDRATNGGAIRETALSPGRYVIAVAITRVNADGNNETVTVRIYATVVDPSFSTSVNVGNVPPSLLSDPFGNAGDGRVLSPYPVGPTFGSRIQVNLSQAVTNRTLNRVLRVQHQANTEGAVFQNRLNRSDERPIFVSTGACDNTGSNCEFARNSSSPLEVGKYIVIFFVTQNGNNGTSYLVRAYFTVS